MSLFPNLRTWFLQNLDTFEIMQGQFEPSALTREIGNNWAEHTAISRQTSILQFLNGKTETISCQIRLFGRDIAFNSVEDDLAKLESWTLSDTKNNRPPICTFWVGDGHIILDCVIDSLSGISYGRPTFFGGLKDVSLTINLKKYKKFSLTDKGTFETRYHRARDRDYYELLTQREYGNPLIGDVIRKRHPTKPNLQVGDIVKLPSIEAIRRDKVDQKSIALQTAYGKKDTPQRRLRLEMFEARNRSYVSHVILED